MNRTMWVEGDSFEQHVNSAVSEDEVLLLMVLNAYAEVGIT